MQRNLTVDNKEMVIIMKNQKNNKIYILIFSIIVIIILLAGATFAYWTWGTVRNNEANISITVTGSTSYLYAKLEGGEPINTEEVQLLPTNNCTGPSALQRTVSIRYNNATSTIALVEAQLDLTDMSLFNCDNELDDDELSHMHWAITTNSSSCSNNVISSGTFEGMEFICAPYGSGNGIIGATRKHLSNTIEDPLYGTIFPLRRYTYTDALGDNEEHTLTLPMISIAAEAGMTNESTNTYYIYIWIDENYNWTNYGDSNEDPLGDLNFKLEWHAKIDQNLVCGDVTGDGVLNWGDYYYHNDAIVGITTLTGDRFLLLGDMNSDGNIDSYDGTLIAAAINGAMTPNCPTTLR